MDRLELTLRECRHQVERAAHFLTNEMNYTDETGTEIIWNIVDGHYTWDSGIHTFHDTGATLLVAIITNEGPCQIDVAFNSREAAEAGLQDTIELCKIRASKVA